MQCQNEIQNDDWTKTWTSHLPEKNFKRHLLNTFHVANKNEIELVKSVLTCSQNSVGWLLKDWWRTIFSIFILWNPKIWLQNRDWTKNISQTSSVWSGIQWTLSKNVGSENRASFVLWSIIFNHKFMVKHLERTIVSNVSSKNREFTVLAKCPWPKNVKLLHLPNWKSLFTWSSPDAWWVHSWNVPVPTVLNF